MACYNVILEKWCYAKGYTDVYSYLLCKVREGVSKHSANNSPFLKRIADFLSENMWILLTTFAVSSAV